MSASLRTTKAINLDVYAQTQRNLSRLSRYFPQDFVLNLARDVLLDLTRRGQGIHESIVNPTEEQIRQLCEALVSEDENAGANFILAVRDDGASPETVYLKYLAEAARMLGQWWENDQVSFAVVTLGSSRIFSIMSAMRSLFVPRVMPPIKTAVFASIPDEKHILGVRMAADIFRSDGWNIDLKIGYTHDELIAAIDWQSTCLIGLSYGGQHSLQALSRLMVAIRINGPAVDTIVCGQDVSDIRNVMALAGAAACSQDVNEALSIMNTCWDEARSPFH